MTSGTVTTDTTFIGYNGTGTLNLTGGNLTTGQFFVGYNGAGTLNLIGGNLTTGQSIIGTNIDSTATVSAGTWTLNSSLQIGFNAAIGTLTIDAGGTVIAEDLGRNPGSTINLNAGGTLQINGSMFTNFLGGTGDLANNGTLIFNLGSGNISHSGVFSGSGSLIKQGYDTLSLSGANTYSGATTISAGTLELSGAAGALTATSAVDINGGTLLLSGSAADRISNAATLSLGAATGSILQLSGAVTETLGALTLTSGAGARVIDFGATSGVLTLDSLSAASHLPLHIWNWSGTIGTGGGTDRLFITNGFGGSLAASDISFFSDSGTTLLAGPAVFNSSGELVPVPEANTLLGVLGLMAPLAWRERRHWMRCRAARP